LHSIIYTTDISDLRKSLGITEIWGTELLFGLVAQRSLSGRTTLEIILFLGKGVAGFCPVGGNFERKLHPWGSEFKSSAVGLKLNKGLASFYLSSSPTATSTGFSCIQRSV
jgi:hypothetical protein